MCSNKPSECLLVSCVSSDPFSTLLLNPLTGTSCWSFRGTELQGGISGVFEPLGTSVRHAFVSIFNKAVLYCVAINAKSGHFVSRSVLPGTVKCLAAHPSGEFLFASIENRIYTWAVSTGELLSIAEDALQEVTVLKLSSCASYLVIGLAEGYIKVYTIYSLIIDRQRQVDPIYAVRSIPAHSLAVTDVYVSGDATPRILSASLDHTVVLSGLNVSQPLLKISVDQPITSCCMDPAESRIIFGLKSGRICIVDLMSYLPYGGDSTTILNTAEKSTLSGLQFFEQHSENVCKLCVNMDATLLASADVTGNYCIWDINNGQCLKASSMKKKVSVLKFTEYWPSVEADAKKPDENAACRRPKQSAGTSMPQLKSAISTHPPSISCTLLKPGHKASTADIENALYSNFEELQYFIAEENPSLLSDIAIETSNRFENALFSHADPNSINEDVEAFEVPSMEIGTSFGSSKKEPQTSKRKRETPNGSTASEDVNPSLSGMTESSAERIRELEREIKRLRKVNKDLYENAAKFVLDEDF